MISWFGYETDLHEVLGAALLSVSNSCCLWEKQQHNYSLLVYNGTVWNMKVRSISWSLKATQKQKKNPLIRKSC